MKSELHSLGDECDGLGEQDTVPDLRENSCTVCKRGNAD